MHFGIAFPTYIDAWRDAEIAEANGFSHAWFYDSQLLYSDVWASMALAAEHTRSMILGTLVAIPTNRIAPVTASAAATINAIAPGHVLFREGQAERWIRLLHGDRARGFLNLDDPIPIHVAANGPKAQRKVESGRSKEQPHEPASAHGAGCFTDTPPPRRSSPPACARARPRSPCGSPRCRRPWRSACRSAARGQR
jgi:Luciferase-like monooxygenase